MQRRMERRRADKKRSQWQLIISEGLFFFLDHLSLARPITCLISRPDQIVLQSPPESSCVLWSLGRFILMQARKKCLQSGFGSGFLSSLSFFAFCLPHNGSQIKNVRQPCLRLAAFHFSCWSLNCLRHDTCHKVAHTHSRGPERASARATPLRAFCVK